MIDGNPMASGEQMIEKKKSKVIEVREKEAPERVKVTPVAPPEHLQQQQQDASGQAPGPELQTEKKSVEDAVNGGGHASAEAEKRREEAIEHHDMTTLSAEDLISEREKISWELIKNSDHRKAKVATKEGVEFPELDEMNIKELAKELENDTHKKHEAFNGMEEAVTNLIKYAESGGKIEVNEGGVTSMKQADFFKSLYLARQTVDHYVFTHRGHIFTTSGRRRLQISLRLKQILKSLDTDIKKEQEKLTGREARIAKYKAEGLSDEKITEAEKTREQNGWLDQAILSIQTGNIGPELSGKDAQKQRKNWILGNYSEKLVSMMKEGKVYGSEKEKDEFFRFILDQNNRALVNEMTITLLVEESADLTLHVPALKDDMRSFFRKKIDEDKDLITKDPKEFRVKINEFKESYANDTANKDRLEKAKTRRDRFLADFDLSVGMDGIWDRALVENMLLNMNDEDFEKELAGLKEQLDSNDKMLNDIIDEKVSAISREGVKKAMRKNLGAMRVFGDEGTLVDQAGVFLDMLKYTCPREAYVEQNLKYLMKEYGIDASRRDTFAKYMTKKDAHRLDDATCEEFDILSDAEEFQSASKKASNMVRDAIKKKGLKLSEEDWKEIDKLNVEEGGVLSSKKFKERLKEITDRSYDLGFTHNDYINGARKMDPPAMRRFGFEHRMHGELFLGAKIVKESFTEEELKVLHRNLKTTLAANLGSSGVIRMGRLDHLTYRQYAIIGRSLIKNIKKNKAEYDKIKDSPKNKELKHNMLLKMASRSMEPAEFAAELEKEKKLIEDKNRLMETKFLATLGMEAKKDARAPYRRLHAEMLNLKDSYNSYEEKARKRLEKRRKELKAALKKAGYDELEMIDLEQKLTPLMSYVLDEADKAEDEDIVEMENKNLRRYGVRSWNDALNGVRKYARQLQEDAFVPEIDETAALYEKHREILEKYKGGRYKNMAYALVDIPEVYQAMMAKDEKVLRDYIKEVLDVRFADVNEAMKEVDMAAAVQQQYMFQNARLIFEGKKTATKEEYRRELNDYNERFYKELFSFDPKAVRKKGAKKEPGQDRIKDNMTRVMSELKDALSESLSKEERKQLKGHTIGGLEAIAITRIQKIMRDGDPEEFSRLMDYESLKEEMVTAARNAFLGRAQAQIKAKNAEAEKYERENVLTEEQKAKRSALHKEIDDEKSAGWKKRYAYLGLDAGELERIRRQKSLVHFGKDAEDALSLNMKYPKKLRGMIDKYAGDLELPPILRDALLEHGSVFAGGFDLDAMKADDEFFITEGKMLRRHAVAMADIFQALTGSYDTEKAMGADEAQMFILRMYQSPSFRSRYFDPKGRPDTEAIKKSPLYEPFRENYKKLKAFESIETDDPILARRQIDMSKNLRALMITNHGLLGEDGKPIEYEKLKDKDAVKDYMHKVGDAIARHTEYFSYTTNFMQIAITKISAHPSFDGLSDDFKHEHLRAMEQYFRGQMIEELSAGHKFDDAAKTSWTTKIEALLADKEKMRELSVLNTSLSYKQAEMLKNGDEDSSYCEQDIAKAIDAEALIFKGRYNKYQKLTMDQKKFFAVALMVMDKGAIGMDAQGTAEMLASPNLKSKQVDGLREQIERYIQTGKCDLVVDYKEAFNKLTNYGVSFTVAHTAVSKTAYEKALQFALSVEAKRKAFGEKDEERLSDGISSIRAAAAKYGKKQNNEVDKLDKISLKTTDVKNRLMAYAKGDGESTILEKLNKLDDSELRLLIRILQDRTVLDRSTIVDEEDPGKTLYAADADPQHQRRSAMLAALSGDEQIRLQTMEGFDDDLSCHKALTTALSFQLRDDMNFRGKELTREHFVDKSFNRTTLVDWNLIKSAFSFMEEITQKRRASYALRHARDYIEFSGNEKAIEANKKLMNDFKKKEDFKPANFDEYMKKLNEDATDKKTKRLMTGYYSLTDKQKKLFIKALTQRDILDISKKGYVSSFFGNAERDYVNASGRYALIDQYIEQSKGDNIGITLSETDCFNAMQSLFSTQISDIASFKKDGKLDREFSWERFVVMGRGTAVDWKLFQRALSFVERATDELESREGHAELYRAAGDVSLYGHMDLDYSFLRKNYHRPGNHIFRWWGQKGAAYAKEKLKINDTIDGLMGIVSSAESVVGAFGKDSEAYKTMHRFNAQAKKLGEKGKGAFKDPSATNVVKMNVAQEEKQEEKKEDTRLYYEKIRDGIKNVVANSKSIADANIGLANYLRENFVSQFEALKDFTAVESKEASKDSGNLVNELMVESAKMQQHGDFRDTFEKGKGMAGAVKTAAWDLPHQVLKTGATLPFAGEQVKKLTTLMDTAITSAVEAVTLRFLNDKIMHQQLDLSEKKDDKGNVIDPATVELNELKKAVRTFTEGVFEDVLGKDAMAQITEKIGGIETFTKTVNDQISAVVKYIDYGKKVVAHVQNVYDNSVNMRYLEKSRKNASEQEEADRKKLEGVQYRQTPEQQEMVRNILLKDSSLQSLATEIAGNSLLEKSGGEIINFVFETVNMFGGKLDIGMELMADAIKAGIEFAMYLTRILADRSELNRYFKTTKYGQNMIQGIKQGINASGNSELLEDLEADNVLGLIRDAKGYESEDELARHTGMQLAQSTIFCASNYNPMAQTRIMAITVMASMGLADKIGDTSPATAERLFNIMRMGGV